MYGMDKLTALPWLILLCGLPSVVGQSSDKSELLEYNFHEGSVQVSVSSASSTVPDT